MRGRWWGVVLVGLVPACGAPDVFCEPDEPCNVDPGVMICGDEVCPDNPCVKTWVCVPAGCHPEDVVIPEQDTNKCNVEECDPETGGVRHIPYSIDDGDDCTLDECSPGLGVSHTDICN
jgi:hypothetical protein